jgi:hypothetical protein
MHVQTGNIGSVIGFFNEDFWRNVVGTVIGAVLMSGTAAALYRYVFRKTLAARETVALFFGLTIFLTVALLTLANSIRSPVVVETDTSLSGTVSALRTSVQQFVEQ